MERGNAQCSLSITSSCPGLCSRICSTLCLEGKAAAPFCLEEDGVAARATAAAFAGLVGLEGETPAAAALAQSAALAAAAAAEAAAERVALGPGSAASAPSAGGGSLALPIILEIKSAPVLAPLVCLALA
jgi:hypothetical protein